LGDWNAKVRREEIYQGIIGKHSMHLNTNNNGQKLVDFAADKNTVVSSTCFPHKEIHKLGDLATEKLIIKSITC
jgi:hypothetical protein